jgi:hypothetical protein
MGGQPTVAIGLESSHRILIYKLVAAGECPLVRVCWGHTGIVRTLYPSPDQTGRYLISRADDGTVRFWSLERSIDPDPLWSRWGVRFAPDQGGLQIAELDDNGPLFNKGVRVGDVLTEIRWEERTPQRTTQRVQEPQAIAARLAALAPQTVASFFTLRGGMPRPPFQVLEAWYPLLSFLAVDDQWIAWSSAGYYTCSAGGERLIGWQLKNELGTPPAFFTAQQFNKVFYRSDVVQKLLTTGHVTKALELASGQANTAVQALMDVLPPRVQVTLPDRQQPVPAGTPVRVRVEATSRTSEPIEAIQALVNGTRSGPPRKVAATGPTATVDLEVKLPPGGGDVVAVALTKSSYTESAAVHALVQGNPQRPKLFLLAVGISKYRDPKLNLQAPEQDARHVAEVMQAQFPSEQYSGIESRVLVNEQATGGAIDAALSSMVKDMELAPGRDVGVVFLSCHGDVDGEFYLLPHEFDENNKAATAYPGKTLVQHFADSQNQWLLVLNACHSGAIDELLLQTRMLGTQLGRIEFSVQLLAACAKEEIALQDHFASAVVRGLKGGADVSVVKGLVETGELRLFVRSEVSSRTLGRQSPVEFNTTRDRPFVLTKAVPAAP